MIAIEEIKVGGFYKKCNKVLRVVSIFNAYSSAFGKSIKHVEVEWAAGKRLGQDSKVWWLAQLAAWSDTIIDREKEARQKELALREELKQINKRRADIQKESKELYHNRINGHKVNCLRCDSVFISTKDRYGRTIKRICPDCTAYNEALFGGSY